MSYKLLERRFYHLGVSASQARVLAVLHFAKEPIKPSLVATLLFQETQSITGILHRIESRGWVRRLPDPNDRRAVGLELTDKGREITEEIVKISEELYDDMFGAGADRDREAPGRGDPEEGARARASSCRRRTSSSAARSSTRSGRTEPSAEVAQQRARRRAGLSFSLAARPRRAAHRLRATRASTRRARARRSARRPCVRRR